MDFLYPSIDISGLQSINYFRSYVIGHNASRD